MQFRVRYEAQGKFVSIYSIWYSDTECQKMWGCTKNGLQWYVIIAVDLEKTLLKLKLYSQILFFALRGVWEYNFFECGCHGNEAIKD